MKRLLCVLLLGSLVCVVRAADESPAKTASINVSDGATMDIAAPAGWSLDTSQPDPKTPATTVLKSAKGDADLEISFIADKDGDFSTKEKLTENVERVAKAQFADISVEKAVKVQTLDSPNGLFVYAEFTDAAPDGKPALPPPFKVVATGLMQFSKTNTVAIVTLMGAGFDDKAYTDAKNVLKSGVTVHK